MQWPNTAFCLQQKEDSFQRWRRGARTGNVTWAFLKTILREQESRWIIIKAHSTEETLQEYPALYHIEIVSKGIWSSLLFKVSHCNWHLFACLVIVVVLWDGDKFWCGHSPNVGAGLRQGRRAHLGTGKNTPAGLRHLGKFRKCTCWRMREETHKGKLTFFMLIYLKFTFTFILRVQS